MRIAAAGGVAHHRVERAPSRADARAHQPREILPVVSADDHQVRGAVDAIAAEIGAVAPFAGHRGDVPAEAGARAEIDRLCPPEFRHQPGGRLRQPGGDPLPVDPLQSGRRQRTPRGFDRSQIGHERIQVARAQELKNLRGHPPEVMARGMDSGAKDRPQLRIRIKRQQQGEVGRVERAGEGPARRDGRAFQRGAMASGAAQDAAQPRAVHDDGPGPRRPCAVGARLRRPVAGRDRQAKEEGQGPRGAAPGCRRMDRPVRSISEGLPTEAAPQLLARPSVGPPKPISTMKQDLGQEAGSPRNGRSARRTRRTMAERRQRPPPKHYPF